MSHRSEAFTKIAESSLEKLRQYLHVPHDYHILYTESATHAWHSMVANAVKDVSAHVVSGAFSAKAVEAAQKLGKEVKIYTVNPQEEFPSLPKNIDGKAELLTICMSESSNGSAVGESALRQLRACIPTALLGVDVTSCAGSIRIDLQLADIWYFSVQKAFGLPSGLGVLILSPTAIERSRVRAQKDHNLAGIWQWDALVKNYKQGRGPTIYTPNMLAVYLLNKQASRFLDAGGLATIEKQTRQQAARIYTHLETHPTLSPYIPNPMYRSATVITAIGTPEAVEEKRTQAHAKNMRLGQGYGELKRNTLRIANFPSITDEDVTSLLEWL